MKAAETMPNVPAAEPSKEDLCTIIYTSGTTGLPKGVELSHINITSDIYGAKALSKESLNDNVSLAFLPWAHIYGMSTELNALISTGSALAIVPHRDQILECLQISKPTVIFSVPVLFNKVSLAE
jgi:long-chain acyl-CoA synthetase